MLTDKLLILLKNGAEMLFEHKDYRAFLKEWMLNPENKRKAQNKQIAEFLDVSPVIVSQVLNYKRNFSEEQGILLSDWLKLNRLEAEYFLTMIQKERSGHFKLTEFYENKLTELKTKSQDIKNRIHVKGELSTEKKAIYYSNYLYGAIRFYCALSRKGKSITEIQNKYSIERNKLDQILNFLVETGLVETENDKYFYKSKSTHVEKSQVLVGTHHANWRRKAMEEIQSAKEENFFFTAPAVISKDLKEELKAELLYMIEKFSKKVQSSKAETMVCFNIDLFDF
ncbi:MAG: DUF4423 domain-containing protein [Bdellovibrionales bacterium]